MVEMHGGNIWKAARVWGLKPEEILDFSVNVNPLGPSRKAQEAIRKNYKHINCYPDPECAVLKKALSRYLKIGEEHIVIGNGTMQIIYLAAKVFNFKYALIPVPTFCEYEFSILRSGGRCKFLKLPPASNFEINVEEILKAATGADVVFLCNPNNPTGSFLRKEKVISLSRALAEKGIPLLLDEAFIDFLPDEKEETLTKEALKFKNLIVLRSLSKFFCLPGLRIGYALAPKKTAKKISDLQETWSVNHLGQMAAEAALSDLEYIDRTKKFLLLQRGRLFKRLSEIKGLRPYPSAANFILCKINNRKLTSTGLRKILARRGILIRDCASFRGLDSRHIRLAVKSEQENERLLTALNKIF